MPGSGASIDAKMVDRNMVSGGTRLHSYGFVGGKGHELVWVCRTSCPKLLSPDSWCMRRAWVCVLRERSEASDPHKVFTQASNCVLNLRSVTVP